MYIQLNMDKRAVFDFLEKRGLITRDDEQTGFNPLGGEIVTFTVTTEGLISIGAMVTLLLIAPYILSQAAKRRIEKGTFNVFWHTWRATIPLLMPLNLIDALAVLIAGKR